MKSVIALALVGSAAAFAPQSQGPVSIVMHTVDMWLLQKVISHTQKFWILCNILLFLLWIG